MEEIIWKAESNDLESCASPNDATVICDSEDDCTLLEAVDIINHDLLIHNMTVEAKCGGNGSKSSDTSSSKTNNLIQITMENSDNSCYICYKTFKLKAFLIRHELNHLGPLACGVCRAIFFDIVAFKQYKVTHRGEKSFGCEFCSKLFGSIQGFNEHIRIHTGEVKCNICSKVFTRQVQLKEHLWLHMGKSPYTCDMCGKSFTMSHKFKHNKMLHLEEASANFLITCKMCGKSFVACMCKSFKCSICSETVLRQQLARHRRIHTGENSESDS